MSGPTLSYVFNVYAVPAEDVPGQWVSYCLELDLVSQGNDAQHSIKMMAEAVMHLLRDSQHDQLAFELRPAPAENWLEYKTAPCRGQLKLTVEYKEESPRFVGISAEPELIANAG